MRPMPESGRLARLKASTDGIAAVEFAYLAPIMLLIFAGAFELSRAIGVDRRFPSSTAMGDLVSREKDVDQNKLDGMMEAIDHVMKPYDPSTLQIGVISVQVEKDIPKVKWTYSHNQAPYRRSAAQLAPMMFPRPSSPTAAASSW